MVFLVLIDSAFDLLASELMPPESITTRYCDVVTSDSVLYSGAIILFLTTGKVGRNHWSNTLVQTVKVVLCE